MPPTLPTRKIGSTSVAAIGYGAMGIATAYGDVGGDDVRLKFLDDLYESGCLNWDTANVYSDSEDLIGKWFAKTGKRDEIFLATKFGFTPQFTISGDPEYAKACLEQSLKRLQVDHVDLWYLHRPDPKVPIEKTVGAMAEMVKAGKTKYIGLSECNAATLRRAYAVHPIAAIQVEYSLFELDIEKLDILKTARELGIAVVAYSPLGRGLLTGHYKSPDDFEANDFRRTIPRFSKENFHNILAIVDAVSAVGKKYDATPGQVALAWLLAQGEDIIPIPGTKKQKYLEENLGALKIKLSAEDVAELRELAENAASAGKLGDRYGTGLMEMILLDTPPLTS